jgi:hypothetical protein
MRFRVGLYFLNPITVCKRAERRFSKKEARETAMSKKSLWADDSRCLHSHPTTCHAGGLQNEERHARERHEFERHARKTLSRKKKEEGGRVGNKKSFHELSTGQARLIFQAEKQHR